MKLLHENVYLDQGFHNFEDNLTQPRHRWYPFKEGFSGELVTEAIRSIGGIGKNGRKLAILDPFCGSGTTPVVAALGNHNAHAVEVNPFCAFTSRVKCLPGVWRKGAFDIKLNEIIKNARADQRESILEKQSTFSKRGGSRKWLFNQSVLRAFDATWRAANSLGGAYRSAFQLAAMRSAMDCCNAKKDGKALRYHDDWEGRNYSARTFFEHLHIIANQFREDTTLAPIKSDRKICIRSGDARKSLHKLASESFDLLVTSPPYLNSFDYSDIYRPELFLGGYVRSNEDLRRIRLRTLRSHIQVKWCGDISVGSRLLIEPLTKLRESESLWSNRLPDMVEAYFHDMHKIFVEAARVLKVKAEAWIVVSTSAYAGIQIPVDLILAELATGLGFELKGVYVLRSLRAAGQQQEKFGTAGHPLRESLIVLVRDGKRVK
jgi:DNA modification methylase